VRMAKPATLHRQFGWEKGASAAFPSAFLAGQERAE